MQERVARVLKARQPVAFGAHDPQHLRRQRAARIDAAHHRRTGDARNLQRHDGLCLLGRERARQIHEPAALGELAEHDRLRLAQQRCQSLRRGEGILDEVRRRRDVLRGLGDGEVDPVAVGDRAALSGHRFVRELLAACGLAQRAAAEGAEVESPSGGQDE